MEVEEEDVEEVPQLYLRLLPQLPVELVIHIPQVPEVLREQVEYPRHRVLQVQVEPDTDVVTEEVVVVLQLQLILQEVPVVMVVGLVAELLNQVLLAAAFIDTKSYCPGIDCPREKGSNRPSSYAPLRCCCFNPWVQPEVCRMKTLSCLTRTL